MRDAIVMWRYTKMVVLVALTGAAYVAILLPFKIATIVPGFTEIRPAAGIPIVCGLLFGPAAAWGAAFGNLVGDIFGGMFGPGSIPGFVGNFLLAYVPYRMWRVLRGDRPADGSPRELPWLALCAVAGGVVCGVVIAFGVAAMQLVPYPVLSITISLNNGIIGTIVAAILLPILYPLAHSFGLLYTDILEPGEYTAGRVAATGMVLVAAGAGLGLIVGASARLAGQVAEGLAISDGTGLLDPQVLVAGIGVLTLLIGTALMSPLSTRAPAPRQGESERQ
ncbi:MAG: QueT transporter family protein [Armatimonadota bacterium]|jgi:energy-coupling factor transport system substrate-specific component